MNITITALAAFAIGLFAAARFDLTPPSVASGGERELALQIGAPAEWQSDPAAHLPMAGFADIADRLTPAVVTVSVEQEIAAHAGNQQLPAPFREYFNDGAPRRVQGSGSGFVITADGYIVTNNHVVAEAAAITVRLADNREFADVELVGRDPTTDVALLKINADGLTPAPLGSSDDLRVGEWVLAIGSPGYGSGGAGPGPLRSTVTAGIVSAKGRNINILNRGENVQGEGANQVSNAIEDFIQTDAVINPGNSGGPLVNARGEVIGINTAIASQSGHYEGYGFAVPMGLAREVIDDIIEFGEVRRAILDVRVRDVSARDMDYYKLDRVAGAVVDGLSEDGPAGKAGVEIGDVIIGIEGEPVASVSDLQRKIRAMEPGDQVEVEVVRFADASHETLTIVLALAAFESSAQPDRLAEAPTRDILGIDVEAIDAETRRSLDLPGSVEGVVITDYDEYGAVGRTVFRPAGKVIQQINRRQIESIEDYEKALEGVEPGDVVGVIMYDPEARRQRPATIQIPAN